MQTHAIKKQMNSCMMMLIYVELAIKLVNELEIFSLTYFAELYDE